MLIVCLSHNLALVLATKYNQCPSPGRSLGVHKYNDDSLYSHEYYYCCSHVQYTHIHCEVRSEVKLITGILMHCAALAHISDYSTKSRSPWSDRVPMLPST